MTASYRHGNQGVVARGENAQILPPADGTANEQDVVDDGPQDRRPHVSRRRLPGISVPGSVSVAVAVVGRGKGGLDAAPEARQAHDVAEGVHGEDGEQAAGAQEQKGGVGAEEGGVGELEEGAQEARGHGLVRVREAELVEVVHVREPEDDGREEDGARHRRPRQEHQGHRGRAEEDLFREGALRGVGGSGQFFVCMVM